MKKYIKEAFLVVLILLYFKYTQKITNNFILRYIRDTELLITLSLILPSLVFYILFIVYDKEKLKSIGNKKDNIKALIFGILYSGISLLIFKMPYMSTIPLSNKNLVLSIASVGIFIPVAEELVFRGILYNESKKNISINGAIFISSITFALSHGDLFQIFNTFVFAIFLAKMYESTDVIYISILAHIGNNLSAIFLEFLTNINVLFFAIPITFAILFFILLKGGFYEEIF